MMQYATLEDTLYFWFAVNDTAGAGADGSAPAFDVRQGGAADSAAPTLSGTPTLLTHANYPAGAYEIAVAATTGNGFAAGSSYGVFCNATVSAVNPTGFVGGFKLSPVSANVVQYLGTASPAAHTAGYPVVTVKDGTGTGEINTNAGAIALVDLVTTATTVTNLTNAPTAGDLTATMKTSIGAAVAASAVASVTGAVGSVAGAVGSVAGNVVGSVGSLAAQAKADVNAEVVDGLATDTYAEPSSVPAATSSLKDKIGYLFAKMRNKRTTTATADVVRNDGDSAAIGTATLSDDATTFTKTKDV